MLDRYHTKIAELLKRPYLRVYTLDATGYIAKIFEFSGCCASGATLEDAKANLEIAASTWLENYLESGFLIPEPIPESIYK